MPSFAAATTIPQFVNSVEDGKIRSQLDSVRSFIRAADPKACVVPLTKGVINITPFEAESLRADFGAEKSFRADFAGLLSYMVALHARLIVEQNEFRAKQDSAYLWKPHADAMAYILSSSVTTFEQANQMLELAAGRGLAEKVNGMKNTVAKLNTELQGVARTLQQITTHTPN